MAYYGTETQQYTYTTIYGHYELQPDYVNGRPYFKMGSRGLWWDGIDEWVIGRDSRKGQPSGFAFYANDVFCPHQLNEWNWRLKYDIHTKPANYDLGIRCKYIFRPPRPPWRPLGNGLMRTD